MRIDLLVACIESYHEHGICRVAVCMQSMHSRKSLGNMEMMGDKGLHAPLSPSGLTQPSCCPLPVLKPRPQLLDKVDKVEGWDLCRLPISQFPAPLLKPRPRLQGKGSMSGFV